MQWKFSKNAQKLKHMFTPIGGHPVLLKSEFLFENVATRVQVSYHKHLGMDYIFKWNGN